jgi:hypothetical protein
MDTCIKCGGDAYEDGNYMICYECRETRERMYV